MVVSWWAPGLVVGELSLACRDGERPMKRIYFRLGRIPLSSCVVGHLAFGGVGEVRP